MLVVYSIWVWQQSRLPHAYTGINDPPIFITTVEGPENEPVARPIGIASFEGRLYVANNNAKRVDIFLPSGKRLRSFHTANAGVQSQILGLAVDWVGKIYVSDGVNGSIKVFDNNGKYLYWFPRPLPGLPPENTFIKPVGIYSIDKKIYVTDTGDNSVKVFATDGTFITKFGGTGKDAGKFSYLNSVALTGDKMIVSDSNNHRVQVLNHQGKFRANLNLPGGKNDWLLPRGVAVDGFDRVHVVDNFANKINVFGPDEKYLFSYPEEDNGETGSLNLPNGIAIDQELRLIYVSDSGNDRVIVWGY